MTGYAVTIGNPMVNSKTTLKPTIALSTIEAKEMALTKALMNGI